MTKTDRETYLNFLLNLPHTPVPVRQYSSATQTETILYILPPIPPPTWKAMLSCDFTPTVTAPGMVAAEAERTRDGVTTYYIEDTIDGNN